MRVFRDTPFLPRRQSLDRSAEAKVNELAPDELDSLVRQRRLGALSLHTLPAWLSSQFPGVCAAYTAGQVYRLERELERDAVRGSISKWVYGHARSILSSRKELAERDTRDAPEDPDFVETVRSARPSE